MTTDSADVLFSPQYRHGHFGEKTFMRQSEEEIKDKEFLISPEKNSILFVFQKNQVIQYAIKSLRKLVSSEIECGKLSP